jgi:hypothetical protein
MQLILCCLDVTEDVPVISENKCDVEVKLEEKSEVLDNLDDEDYRYNLGNDGAAQNYFDLVQVNQRFSIRLFMIL